LNINTANKELVLGEFTRIFSKMLGIFRTETTRLSYPAFYRIRYFDYLIGHIDELWAPPPNKTKKGRCNFDQEPVLYVSTDPANCFAELNIQLKQQVYMICYKRKIGSLSLRAVFGTDLKAIGLEEQIFTNENDTLSYRILREFLRSEFMKPTCRECSGSNFIYNMTASICSLLRAGPNVDGFVYPSAVNSFNQNVALLPDCAKQKLELQDVRIVKLISNNADEVAYEFLFKGILDDKKQVNWIPFSGKGSFCKNPPKI